MRRTAIFIGLCALTSWTAAADPVKHVGIYVQPYYESARSANEKPRVAVHKKYNELLSSNRQQDIIVARDMIQREPQLITPMTLMVLAIRLYDVGLRDDSVFWFYVAKDRFATLADTGRASDAGFRDTRGARNKWLCVLRRRKAETTSGKGLRMGGKEYLPGHLHTAVAGPVGRPEREPEKRPGKTA